MGISESQLETWSHQGSVQQSSSTYATVKNALEATGSAYANKGYSVFLQGSYCNDTNVYSESDVDAVIQLNSAFHHDLDVEALPPAPKAAFKAAYVDATYTLANFKGDVVKQLEKEFKTSVQAGTKAIKIEASGNRRSADVLATMKFRRYHHFVSTSDESYTEGVCFFTSGGARVANYPKQHSANCTTKHQATESWYKPTVRIFKNLRRKLVADGVIASGIAPSYYIEGLLYNVPKEKFGGSYASTVVKCLDFIATADRSKFLCVNEQYRLLNGDPNVTWSAANCEAFLAAAVDAWNKG